MRRTLIAIALAACGVRTAARVDGTKLELEARVQADPRDVGARLALARVDDEAGRPSAAISQLEKVVTLGGPLGIRWRDEDQQRLARLIAQRGRVRLARGAASALDDLRSAKHLGAAVTDAELHDAERAVAIAALRHVDAEVRARGQAILARRDDFPGARATATPAQRGAFGAWLWSIGAKRAAWIELAAWHDHSATREPALEVPYVAARTWWTPVDAPVPTELAGAERCRFGGCSARDVAVADDPLELRALLASRVRTDDPAEAIAWIRIGLRASLRGFGSWGRVVRTHVDVDAVLAHGLAEPYREILIRLGGRGTGPTLPQIQDRVATAAELALAGASLDRMRQELGPEVGDRDGSALLAMFTPPIATDGEVPDAIAHAIAARVGVDGTLAAALPAIVRAFHRDPAIAERLARDAIARAPDAAIAHAVAGAAFDALGDPARARIQWQAAADASAEPAFFQGLAETEARGGDADAAMVAETTAAAASGDPGPSWLALARALRDAGNDPVALDAAKYAIDLATADDFAAALELAIEGSYALGREAQAHQLEQRRAAFAVAPPEARPDPTDATAALAAYRETPSASTLARLWVASRWNPRDLATRAALLSATPADDPRHAAIRDELLALAGDPALSRAALSALR